MTGTRGLGLAGALVAVALLAAGCIDSLTVIEVTKDGSGTIVVREFYSPMMTEAFGGMAQMMTMGTDGGTVTVTQTGAEGTKKLDLVAEAAKQKVKEFGPGVEQVDYAEKTNAAGWKGFQAKYRFKDISTVRVAVGSSEMASSGGPPEAPKAEAGPASGGPTYTFRFASGQTAVLEIVPVETPPEKAPAPAAGGVQVTAGPGAQPMPGMEQMPGAMMAQMMGPMLQGMRLRLMVTVAGSIAETNSAFRWQQALDGGVTREGVTVMDVQMDKLLANPQAAALMSAQDPKEQAKLATLKLDGVQLEDPAKTIRVSFK